MLRKIVSLNEWPLTFNLTTFFENCGRFCKYFCNSKQKKDFMLTIIFSGSCYLMKFELFKLVKDNLLQLLYVLYLGKNLALGHF